MAQRALKYTQMQLQLAATCLIAAQCITLMISTGALRYHSSACVLLVRLCHALCVQSGTSITHFDVLLGMSRSSRVLRLSQPHAHMSCSVTGDRLMVYLILLKGNMPALSAMFQTWIVSAAASGVLLSPPLPDTCHTVVVSR